MKSRLHLFILLVCFNGLVSAQQEKTQYIHKHLMRATASVVGGYLIKEDISNVHIDGSAEYYMDNKVSVRGSASYLLGSNGLTQDSMGLKDFHSIYLGLAYHLPTKSHFDPYIMVQPGLSYTSSYKMDDVVFEGDFAEGRKTFYPGTITPLATAGVGFNYYFQRFAHVFVDTRYVYGRHLTSAPAPISLEELRITFGLGFNLFIMKERKKLPA